MMGYDNTKQSADAFDRFLTIQLKVAIALLGIVTFSFVLIPWVVLPLVNKKLKAMPDFSGVIRKMRLNLFDASVTIGQMALVKKNHLVPVAFFTQDHMKISLRIFRRRLLADISVNKFNINLVKGAKDDDSQMKIHKAWIELARKLMIFNISRLQIENGSTHFRTYHTNPQVNVHADNIRLVAENLNIRSSEENLLPAKLHVTADVHGGSLDIEGTLNPRNPVPTFDLNMELEGLKLREINSALLAYANVDVTRGTFSMSAEVAAQNRKIAGYLKPVIHDLKLFNWEGGKRNSLKKMAKELFIDGVVSLFKNRKHDQLATKIVIDGEIDDPDIDPWSIVGCMFFNAFVESLLPHVEDSITIDSVGNMKNQACDGDTGC